MPTKLMYPYNNTCHHAWIVHVLTPFTESRSGIKQTLTSPDSQEAVGDYYGVQHDAKELRMGPKCID